MSDLKRPALKLIVKLDEGEKTIKWTYGLSQDLQRVCPDAAAIFDVMLGDAPTREYLMRRALTESRALIKDMDELVDPADVGLDDPDEQNKLLNWLVEHLLYFFATSAGGLKRLGESFGQHLKVSAPPELSLTGSPA